MIRTIVERVKSTHTFLSHINVSTTRSKLKSGFVKGEDKDYKKKKKKKKKVWENTFEIDFCSI